MNDNCCLTVAASGSGRQMIVARNSDDDRQTRKFVQRFFDIAGWIIPGTILALLPKCPACLAAYFAIGTGFGLSVSSAASLRMVIMILCVATLSYVVAKGLRRFFACRAYYSARKAVSGSIFVTLRPPRNVNKQAGLCQLKLAWFLDDRGTKPAYWTIAIVVYCRHTTMSLRHGYKHGR